MVRAGLAENANGNLARRPAIIDRHAGRQLEGHYL